MVKIESFDKLTVSWLPLDDKVKLDVYAISPTLKRRLGLAQKSNNVLDALRDASSVIYSSGEVYHPG
jgi:hypothetical protein